MNQRPPAPQNNQFTLVLKAGFSLLGWLWIAQGSVIAQSPEQSAGGEPSTKGEEVQPALPVVRSAGFDPSVIENASEGNSALRLQLLETYEELYNWEMTKALAQLILEKDGAGSVPALRAVTAAYLRMKKGDLALDSANRLAKLDPSTDTKALVAQALILLARHSEAAKVLSQLKAEIGSPPPFPWQEELAFALFHSGDTPQATKAFNEIANDESYSAKVRTTANQQLRLMLALEAQRWMHEGENGKAITILEKLERSGGKTFEYQEDLGYAYQNAGRLQDARNAFQGIVAGASYNDREKSNAHDQINLLDSVEAEQLKDQGDYEQALALLSRLKKKFNNSIFPFQDQLAFTLSESGDTAAARQAFQEIASNQAYPAIQRKKARKEIQEMDIAELLSKGYAALEGHVNWRQAKQIDALLIARHSDHPDAVGFHASILTLSGQCDKAIQLLEQLRDRQADQAQYVHAGLLAECYYQVGRFEDAKTAYREAFETSGIEASEQISLRDSYQGFRKESRPTMSIGITGQNENDGNTTTTEIETRVPFGAGWAVGAEFKRFDTDGGDRQEILASIEKGWGQGYYAQAKVGTNDDSAAYAVKTGKRIRAHGKTEWSTSFHKNETADDTSQLTAEGGRQDRAAVDIQHDVSPNLRLTAGGDWRSVDTETMDLGSGYDLNFEAAYGWNMANSRQRSFEIAYVASISSFDNENAASSNPPIVAAIDGNGELIDTDYHRQGAEARWFGNYGRFEPYTMAGGYYRIDEGSFEYEIGGGVDFDMNEDTTLYLRGHYTSSGEGQNSGEGVVEGQIGVETTF